MYPFLRKGFPLMHPKKLYTGDWKVDPHQNKRKNNTFFSLICRLRRR